MFQGTNTKIPFVIPVAGWLFDGLATMLKYWDWITPGVNFAEANLISEQNQDESKLQCNFTPWGDGENRRELGRKEKEKPKSKILMS